MNMPKRIRTMVMRIECVLPIFQIKEGMAVNNSCSFVLFEDQIMPTDQYDYYDH